MATSPKQLSLRLFGAPQVAFGEQAVAPRFQKELALLVYLAVTGRPHTRQALAALLWPESDQPRALAALRRAIYQLRRDLGEEALEARRQSVRLSAVAAARVDTQAFLEAARACQTHDHPPQSPPAPCAAALEAAVRLYSDDFLAGFSLPDSPAFDEWQFFEREGLRAELLRVLALLTAHYERQRAYHKALDMARTWLSHEPYHEPAHRALIRLYTLLGQPAEARRQYERCKRLLAEEFGTQPHPETEQLYLAILGAGARPGDGARVERPVTRYTQNGATHLAYQVIGDDAAAGGVDLLVLGGFITHLEQLWEEPDLARFLRRLSATSRALVFDRRGVGLSDRGGLAPASADHLADALAILDAAHARRVVVLAVSDGAATAITLATQRPERIAGLVIYGGQAKGVWSDDYPWGLTPAQYQRWADKLVRGWGGPVNLEYFAPTRARDERLRQWWGQTQRLAASPGAVQAILQGMRDADVRGLLPLVRMPTLVLHRRDDRCAPVQSGRYLARHIPHARYVELEGADHWWWIGETEPLHTEISHFLARVARRGGAPEAP